MAELSADARRAVDAAMQLAIQRHQAGDIPAAEALYGKVLTAEATHAGALHNLGLIRLDRGDVAASVVLLSAAVEQRPQEPVFHFNLGLARQTGNDTAGAASAYRKAVQYKPDYRKAWENLGVVLQDLEQHDAAVDAYRRALQLDADSPVANQNLGNALRALGRFEAAAAQYRSALERDPLNADLAVQYGGTLLSTGDLSGWDWYEWRYWSPETLEISAPYPVPLPKWDGKDLTGTELLLYGEQGIGDEVMFASCVPDVLAQGARVTLLSEPRLAALFARSFPGAIVRPKARGELSPLLDSCDASAVRCSLASLPLHLRRTAERFPGNAYLKADAGAVTRWRERLRQPGVRLNVGLSWRGGAARARQARSIALERLAPLFTAANVRFVNLQYGDHRDEIAQFGAAGHQLLCFEEIDPLRDLDGFAALLTALDLVISIDNSTVHLAGALGVPTWLLLPFQADWRWQRGRDDSLWYRSLRLFWQRTPGTASWTEVISRVSAELETVPARESVPDAAGGHVASVAASRDADVLLLNDTSYWYHWGCTCTSLALHEALRDRGLLVDAVPITHINTLAPLPATLADLDDEKFFQSFCARNPALIERLQKVAWVVVNGEGSIHDLGPTALALLYVAYIAKQRLGKHTRIINHSGYPTAIGNSAAADAVYRKIYGVLDFVAVREDLSGARLAQLGIATTASFDCLPLYVARHPPARRTGSERRVVIAGSMHEGPALLDLLPGLIRRLDSQGYQVEILAGANAWIARDDVQLLQALRRRIDGGYRLVAATSEAEWLAGIAGAKLLISGRFHYSIAAACLGTPLLLAASNTTKNDGLLRRLALAKEQVWLPLENPAEVERRVEAMLNDPQRGVISSSTLATLQELARRNFDGLPGL
jgi:tetratricopeptide (TPR) repeat protein/polysaccharide pyruvyl transferase WcaK-like protein